MGSGDVGGDLLYWEGARSECRLRRSTGWGIRDSSRLTEGWFGALESIRNGEMGIKEGNEGRWRNCSEEVEGTGGTGAVRESCRFRDQKDPFLDSDLLSGSFFSGFSSAAPPN